MSLGPLAFHWLTLDDREGRACDEVMGLQEPVDAGLGDEVALRVGETGFLVPRGDIDQVAGRLVELIEHPEKSMAMGIAAQVFANSHFSVDAVARTYSRILHDVAAAIRV
jgi:glycosyltransferase involved in cell wall biosynthesis